MNLIFSRSVVTGMLIFSVAGFSSATTAKRAKPESGARAEAGEVKPAKVEMLFCRAWVLDQDMSPPLSRARLDCDSRETYIDDLTSKGWVQVSQTSLPDGDVGGIAQTQFNLTFRRDPKPARQEPSTAKKQDSKPTHVQTLRCKASILAQDMSPPLSRARLDCGGFESHLSDLMEQGWVQTSQTARPDGDYGGVPNTEITLTFQKNAK